MDKPNAQDLYKIKTGRSWIEAVEESGRLQQEAVDAHAKYFEAYAVVSQEEEHLLKTEMKAKFERSIAYWDRMWQDLKES